MSNTSSTKIDIRASADQVIAHFKQGRHTEALQLLEKQRGTERPAVQEALDRYVAAGAKTELDAFRKQGAAEFSATLERLQQATKEPRMPSYSDTNTNANELIGLTDTQKFDIYASIVETRGNSAARNDLQNGKSVILGLRQENSSYENKGKGVYNDQIIVLRKSANGERNLYISERANTEPSAQYSAHNPNRGRKIQGQDANRDGIKDPGRLAEGTFEMARAIHGKDNHFSLRPSPEQLARNEKLIERDTNGDGWFNLKDANRSQILDRTFKIHKGSRDNTDSAGCQTIHRDEYDAFIKAVQANSKQDRWQYVLTSTDSNLAQEVKHTPQGQSGQANAALKKTQAALNQLGYKGADGKPLAEDGISGMHTRHAIKAFQQKQGLDADGVIGPKTAAALEAATTKQLAPAATASANAPQKTASPAQNAPVNPGLSEMVKKFFPDSAAKHIEALGEKIADAVNKQLTNNKAGSNVNVNVNININIHGSPASEQHRNLTLYCASRCAKENLPLDRIGSLSLEQNKEGKNLIHMCSSDQQQVVTANADKGKLVPAEQSIAAIQQQSTQQQALNSQQQQHASMRV